MGTHTLSPEDCQPPTPSLAAYGLGGPGWAQDSQACLGRERDSADLRGDQDQSGDVLREQCLLLGAEKNGGRCASQECVLGRVPGSRLGGVVFIQQFISF